MNSTENLIVKIDGAITTITLNRPNKLNAIDASMRKNLGHAIDAIAKKSSCRAVIITGSGGRSFSSGDDINMLNEMKTEKEAIEFADELHSIFNRIEELDKLVIAAIDGYCLGGGCELAMACDIRIATPNSTFGLPEVKLGVLPTGGGTYRLPALVGMGIAKEMLLCGDSIDAKEAHRIGLINGIVSRKSLMKEAISIASKTNQNSYNAIKNGKIAINSGTKRNDEIEKSSFVSCFNHKDRKEGLGAFVDHRKPKF